MDHIRREFLKLAGIATLVAPAMLSRGARSAIAPMPGAGAGTVFDVRSFGAAGDGKTIDSPAINRAIEAAGVKGGTVYVPAGTYACYSLRLTSAVALYLDQGATIVAAGTPREGTSSGYDPAESNAPWEDFQDFGHNHWHNSLIWGENIHDVAVLGPGLIWGRGLARGHDDPDLPLAEAPGVGNKAIALKNCHNVILRDFSMLACGHFAILATAVDNLTIDNLKIDTNRDGIDIDCCRNVRVVNCSVNSPWDDAICPKSSFALGYARATENVTIANCYVTGGYQVGSLLDGSFKRFPEVSEDHDWQRTGRIKCGTEFERRIQEHCHRQLHLRELPRPRAGDRGRRNHGRHHGCRRHHARHPQLAAVPASRRAHARAQGHPDRRAQTGADQQCHLSWASQRDALDHQRHPGPSIEDIKISDCYVPAQGRRHGRDGGVAAARAAGRLSRAGTVRSAAGTAFLSASRAQH